MNWTVGKKFSFVFSILMIVIIAIGLVGIVSTYKLNDNTKKTDEVIIPKLQAIHTLESNTKDVHALLQNHILSKDKASEEKYEKQMIETKQKIDAGIVTIQDYIKIDEEQSILNKMKENWLDYKDKSESVIANSVIDNDEVAADDNQEAVILLDNIEIEVSKLNEILSNDIAKSAKTGVSIFKTVLIALITSGVLGLIISVFFTFYLRRTVQNPIIKLSKKFEQLAAGDLTIKPTEVHSKDEIGVLEQNFNRMLEQLVRLIGSLHNHIGTVATTSNKLMSSAEETSVVATQIAKSIFGVSEDATNQMESARSGYRAIEGIAQHMDKATSGVQQVSELSLASTRQTETGRALMIETTKKIVEIELATNQTSKVVEALSEKSGEIGEITSLITSISDQTNLLALNAAIEAARAGEQGKGFAVVADEVRKLAEQSGNAAQHISKLINSILLEVNEAIAAMDTSKIFVKEGIEMAERSGEGFSEISVLVKEVSEEVKKISSITTEISTNTLAVKELMDDVVHLSERTDERAQTVAAAVEEQSANMQEMSDASTQLNGMSSELREVISSFKIN